MPRYSVALAELTTTRFSFLARSCSRATISIFFGAGSAAFASSGVSIQSGIFHREFGDGVGVMLEAGDGVMVGVTVMVTVGGFGVGTGVADAIGV